MLNTIDEDENDLTDILQWSGQTYGLSEDGLYEVLFQSRKPIAKEFKKQVKIILKEIRKNERYIATNESESDEDIIAKALILAQRTIDRKDKMIKSLENEIVESQPMIAIAEAVTESSDNWEGAV